MTPASGRPAEAPVHRLWGGRFGSGSAPELDAANRSIGVDYRLWPFDIRVSKAWAIALWNAGVLTMDESRAIERGLDAVEARLVRGEMPIASDEDVHTMIDRLLHEEAGDVASKLHTGRSRNDQVATSARLWTMDACNHVDVAIRRLQAVIIAQAESLGDAIMPAYTHLQRAQPVLAAHWMLGHFWPLERDRQRFADVARRAAVLPLGSGAIAGCAFPVSRVLLQGSLGFSALSENSIDAVGDRDFVAEMIFAATLVSTHVSRLAEDLIVFGSSEFGFVRFGDAYTTGSSMMPQKRNPDAFELARGSGGRLIGDLTSLLATLKGVPSGYSKDLQDDKRAMFDAVDTVSLVLPAVAGALEESRFQPERMAAAVTSVMMATDLADYLVREGVSFREAHGVVGSLVRAAEQAGVSLEELPAERVRAAHPALGTDWRAALSAAASVAHRDVPGGTAPSSVRAQLEQAKQLLRGHRDTPRGNELRLRVG